MRRLPAFVLFCLLIFGVTIVLPTSQVFAATGTLKQINFQGKVVTKTTGVNIADGDYSFTFRIYDVSSGGTHIWTETKTLTVTNGIFQTLLGSGTALPGSVDFNTDNIYLGINFNSDGEMSPRVQFAAVPQALNALKVAGLTVTDTTGTLTIPNGETVQFADSFITSGANSLTLTTTGATNVTLPTTGTLVTLAGAESLTNKTIGNTGLNFENTESISNGTDGSIFFGRNDAGTVTLTAKDNDATAALTILPGGAAAFVLGGGSTTAITLNTDSTGDAEVVLPGDSIGPSEVNDNGTTLDAGEDEMCLTYENGGPYFEWQSCSGAATTWDTIGDAAGNGAVAFGSTVQTLDWGTMDANASFLSFNFTNAGTSAGTDNGVVINNAVTGSSTDTTTENLLLLQQLDTTAAGTTAVSNAFKIDSAANSGIEDAIEITNSAGNLTNGMNIVDTAGGTLTTGLLMSGTITTGIDLTDTGIGTGISLAANDIVGTTGVINYTNFDVDAAGNITVAAAEGLDTNGAGALEVGKANATSVDICNSTNCDTINIGNLATTDADTIIIGDSSDNTSINDANWSVTSTGVATFLSGAFTGGSTTGVTVVNTTYALSNTGLVDIELTAGDTSEVDDLEAIDVLLNVSADTFAETHAGANIVIDSDASTTDDTVYGLAIRNSNSATANLDGGILINNADTTQTIVDGIIITSSGGGAVTDAIDVSDSNIGTALRVDANDIVGTTGLINYTNFDVDAAGGITVAAAEGLDTNGAGALELGKANATSVDICNSASCDTINIGNLATTDADAIVIGDVLDNVAITGDQWSITDAGVLTVVSCTGCGGGASSLQGAYDGATPTILTDASGDIIFQVIGGATDTQFEVNAASAPEIDMVLISNTAQGTTTTGVNGVQIDFVTGDGTNPTNSGLEINLVSGGTASGDVINGINLTMDAADSSTQTGIVIGTNFDVGIDAGANIITNIGNAGTDFLTNGGLTLANAFTVTTGGATVSSGGMTITAGALAVNSDSITSDAELVIDGTTSVVLGNTTNGFRINETFGSTTGYLGGARPTKRIYINPEYPGASLTGDGGSNTGTMTSDSMTSSPYRNYYNWANTQGTAQDYDIWVSIPVPMDFGAMAGTPTLSIDTYTSDTTNGTVLVTVYDTANAADCTSASFTPTSTTTWQTKTQTTCLDTGTYTAGGIITMQIKLTGAATSGVTRVSNIYFDYLSKF